MALIQPCQRGEANGLTATSAELLQVQDLDLPVFTDEATDGLGHVVKVSRVTVSLGQDQKDLVALLQILEVHRCQAQKCR